jgi:hypothetical protein
MKNLYDSKTGLVQIATPAGYAIGYMPDRSTVCLGEFNTDGFGDMFSDGEYIIIQFNDGKPSQLLELNSDQAEAREITTNEVKIKIGSWFLASFYFSKSECNTINTAD